MRSHPFSKIIMEQFFPVEIEKGEAKLIMKEELTKAPSNLIEIFANQLFSQIKAKKTDKEFDQCIVSDFETDHSMGDISIDEDDFSNEGSADCDSPSLTNK